MSKLMLINVTHAEESRVGIVTNGVLSAFEIESFSREHLKGNIYRGVIHRIHPALEAAFVDIGADRDAFLPLDEICFRNLPNPPERKDADSGNGNGNEGRRAVRIQEILKPGDEILVQIVKEEFANKPPTLSTFYSLPGRYLVLLPGSDDAGISRRIEGEERQRIRELIEQLSAPEGFGLIVRTVAGFDQGARELQRDLSYLLRLWESIQHTAEQRRAPALVYREHDLVLRNIRDYFTPDIDEIWVDNDEVYERARDFLREVMPEKQDVLRLYEGHKPIFSQFDVEGQIETIYKRRVPLRSGGSIVIDGTEALTAIDINSGRSTRGTNQEETAHRTNREAALEIARQLRLRDVGGLIVIDFIDMRNPQHIADVERTLRQAMHEDKARHEVGRISQFGLMEISRQRLRPAAAATSYLSCPMCEGYGLVRTTESAALVGLRKIHNRIAKGDVAALRAVFPPDVGVYLLNQKRDDLAQLERRYGTKIQVAFDDRLMPHQFESEVRLRSEGEQLEQKPLRLGGIANADTQRSGARRSGRQGSGRGARGGERGPAREAGEGEAQVDSGRRQAGDSRPRSDDRHRGDDRPRGEDRPRSEDRPRGEDRPAAVPPPEVVATAEPVAPRDDVQQPEAPAADSPRGERSAKRGRRRRGRRRGRGTGVQAAIAIAEGLGAIAAASPLLAERIAEAAAQAALAPVDEGDDDYEGVDEGGDDFAQEYEGEDAVEAAGSDAASSAPSGAGEPAAHETTLLRSDDAVAAPATPPAEEFGVVSANDRGAGSVAPSPDPAASPAEAGMDADPLAATELGLGLDVEDEPAAAGRAGTKRAASRKKSASKKAPARKKAAPKKKPAGGRRKVAANRDGEGGPDEGAPAGGADPDGDA
jgi:ribonuclease E